MEILQIAIILIIFVLLCIPTGKYIYKVSEHEKTFLDPLLDKVDGFIYKLSGIKKDEEMDWKQYIFALLMCNAIPAFIGYIILRIQAIGILNPNHIKGMEQGLTFNTIVSFLTNTNLQDYSGEAGASYLVQMIVITFFMFFASGTGIAVALAFIRALAGKKKVGNFYVDIVRIITRILLPLSIVMAVFYISQGVPQTLSANKTITTIEGKFQDIPLGPVASLESIKLIGTNGGGFFGANSAHPFENPTPLTNAVQIVTLLLIAGSLVVCFGHMIKNKKQAVTIFAAMLALLLVGVSICYISEKAGNPVLSRIDLNQSMGNMEGKEVRFGVGASALFTTVTTDTSCGAVNNMHDSLTPIGGAVPLVNMMLNVIFGGVGVGFMNMIMYAILTVFLCGLMVGRTPEFLAKKIEGKEIKLVAFAIIIHPLLILMSTAFALSTKQGLSGISNSGFHGLTQVLYQFTSSAANNGSGFEGLADNTMFWNVSTGVIMFLGRYLSIIILLAVAGSFAEKRAVPVSSGTFKTDNTVFTVTLIVIVIVIGALTFLPAVALGPISEYLTL